MPSQRRPGLAGGETSAVGREADTALLPPRPGGVHLSGLACEPVVVSGENNPPLDGPLGIVEPHRSRVAHMQFGDAAMQTPPASGSPVHTDTAVVSASLLVTSLAPRESGECGQQTIELLVLRGRWCESRPRGGEGGAAGDVEEPDRGGGHENLAGFMLHDVLVRGSAFFLGDVGVQGHVFNDIEPRQPTMFSALAAHRPPSGCAAHRSSPHHREDGVPNPALRTQPAPATLAG